MAQASLASDPLPSGPEVAALPPARGAIGLALLLIVFFVSAQLIHGLSLRDGVTAGLRLKLDSLAQQGPDADVILVGTSRTLFGFDPIAFADAARESGCDWQALNMGIPTMDRAAESLVARAISSLPEHRRIVLFESLPLMLTSVVSFDQLDWDDLVQFARAAVPVQENRTDLSLDILWAADRLVGSSALITPLELTGPSPMQADFARGGQLIAESYSRAPPASNLLVNTNSWVEPGAAAARFVALRKAQIAGNWIGGLFALPALSVSGREAVLSQEADRQNLAYFNFNAETVLASLEPTDWFDTWHLNQNGAAKISSMLGHDLCTRYGAAMASEGGN